MARLDASRLCWEIGQRFQTVSVVMDKHRVVAHQQVCACGRIAVRVLPCFGLRCEIAAEEWDLAYAAIQRVLAQLHDTPPDDLQAGMRQDGSPQNDRAVGRATPSRHPRLPR